MEHWREIPGYEGLYEVSSLGRVKALARVETTKAGWSRNKNERILKQTPDKTGRFYVDISNTDGRTRWYIHRLVLTVFVGPCPEGMEACHNDGEYTNNDVANLRWDTHQNNLRDKCKHETMIRGQDHKRAKLHEADIPRIRELVKVGLTQEKVASLFGVSRRLIGGIVNKKKWAHI